MIINKILTGFVIQQYDTDKKQYIGQEFVAGDEAQYEDPEGNCLSTKKMKKEGFGPGAVGGEPYLSYDMVQPRVKGEHCFNSDTGRCIHCGCDEDDAYVGGEPCKD